MSPAEDRLAIEVADIVIELAPDRGGRIEGGSSLVDDLAFDSIGLFELSVVLEKRFRIDLSDCDDVLAAADLDAIVDLTRARLSDLRLT